MEWPATLLHGLRLTAAWGEWGEAHKCVYAQGPVGWNVRKHVPHRPAALSIHPSPPDTAASDPVLDPPDLPTDTLPRQNSATAEFHVTRPLWMLLISNALPILARRC